MTALVANGLGTDSCLLDAEKAMSALSSRALKVFKLEELKIGCIMYRIGKIRCSDFFFGFIVWI